MEIPPELVERINQSEGLELTEYRDSEGIPSLGRGHNLSTPITEAAANLIRDDDIREAAASLERNIPWAAQLDPVRYWSLVELVFNLGMHGLLGFHHMLEALQAKHYVNAGADLLQSKWAEQVGTARSERIANQIINGVWS